MLTNVKMFVFMYHVALMLQCSFVAIYELQLTHLKSAARWHGG